MPFFDADLLPLARKFKVGAVVPPHIVATAIDQFEFEIVDRRVCTHIKRNFVIFVKDQRQFAADIGIARCAIEIEIEAHRLSRDACNNMRR